MAAIDYEVLRTSEQIIPYMSNMITDALAIQENKLVDLETRLNGLFGTVENKFKEDQLKYTETSTEVAAAVQELKRKSEDFEKRMGTANEGFDKFKESVVESQEILGNCLKKGRLTQMSALIQERRRSMRYLMRSASSQLK